MNVDKYLESIQNQDESLFPMDSLHKKKKPFRPVYPESITALTSNKRIMIDFDQTIHSYHDGWSDGVIYGHPLKGAKETIEHLKSIGYEIIIFTARLSEAQEFEKNRRKRLISEWLDMHEILYDDITSDKLPAMCYIDDKAVRFEGCWMEVLQKVEQIIKTDIDFK